MLEKYVIIHMILMAQKYILTRVGKTFQVSSTGNQYYLDDVGEVRLRKSYNTRWTSGGAAWLVGLEMFQALNNGEMTFIDMSTSEVVTRTVNAGDWFWKKDDEELLISEGGTIFYEGYYCRTNMTSGGDNIQLSSDALNYIIDTAKFSEWVDDNLGGVLIEDLQNYDENIYSNGSNEVFNLSFSSTASPHDLNLRMEVHCGMGKSSTFNQHKTEIIKQCIIRGLNEAISNYDRNSEDGLNYELPVLSETDWEQALSNVSMITFVQGIPIGLKQYNSYAISTSTTNKEYISPSEIYTSLDGAAEYHLYSCKHIQDAVSAGGNDLIAYRSIDYKVRQYTDDSGQIQSYYPHSVYNSSTASYDAYQACYYCIIDRSQYETKYTSAGYTSSVDAWASALYRERYVSHEYLNSIYNLSSL